MAIQAFDNGTLHCSDCEGMAEIKYTSAIPDERPMQTVSKCCLAGMYFKKLNGAKIYLSTNYENFVEELENQLL